MEFQAGLPPDKIASVVSLSWGTCAKNIFYLVEKISALFLFDNESGFINCCMQLKTTFLSGLLKGKPAVVWFQQERVFWTYYSISPHNTIVTQFKKCNYVMTQLHHHCFAAFWTRPWVFILGGMKSLQKGHVWGSNMLLKNRMMSNKIFFCFLWG